MSTTKFQINVTKEVYEASKMCGSEGKHGSNCAIAKAISVLFPDIWVSMYRLTFISDAEKFYKTQGTTHYTYGSIHLPIIAIDMIKKFDQSSSEERVNLPEFSFEIEVPDEILEKVVNISSIQEILKDSKTLQLV